MGQMSMLRGVLFLSCLVVVWHATVEALPVYEDADVVLLDTEKVKAKTSPAAKRAKAEAKNQKAKVVRMRAALNGHSSVDTADKTSLPTSTPSTEDSLNVQAPNLARTSSIAKRKAPLNKPSSEEFVNRALTVGSKGFSHQQAERAIRTADHDLYRINKNLRKKRAAKYSAARGAVELKEASAAAAEAAANMAAAVKNSAARKVARVVKKITKLQARMDGVARNNGKGCKPGETPATMKVAMAKLVAKKSGLMAQATLAAKAAQAAISKAASVKGAAQANAINKQDGTTRLESAIVANAKAKIALARFDRQNKIKDQQEHNDKQRATQAKARADAYVKKTFSKVNLSTGTTKTVHIHHHHHHHAGASKHKAEQAAEGKVKATSAGSKLKKAQSAVEVAHASGKVADVKKALKGLGKVKGGH